MRQTSVVYPRIRAHGLRKGDEHRGLCIYTPHGVWQTLYHVRITMQLQQRQTAQVRVQFLQQQQQRQHGGTPHITGPAADTKIKRLALGNLPRHSDCYHRLPQCGACKANG